ncbi:MAG TPA: hypothetical protein VFR09_01370 [Alphaproteobacteria bacterium]|nr:hypothetical protein [Alphaproteobacteria bacterium]
MKTRFSSLLSAAALLAVMLSLAACGCLECFRDDDDSSSSSSMETSTPTADNPMAPGNNVVSSKTYFQLAPIAPPPPQIETKPEHWDDIRATTWRPGYWQYSGGDYHWVTGELIDRPSPTAIWSPDHWVQHTYGWAFVPGYWQ